MQTKKEILKKYTGQGGLKDKINSIASKVANFSGGKDLVDYAGSKIAKMRAPDDQKKYVEDNTSGKKALGSAAKVGLTIASIVGAGAIAKNVAGALAKRGAGKVATNAARKIPIKSSPLDQATGSIKKFDNIGNTSVFKNGKWEHVPNQLKLRTKRSILQDKLKYSRYGNSKYSHQSKLQKGEQLVKDREFTKRTGFDPGGPFE